MQNADFAAAARSSPSASERILQKQQKVILCAGQDGELVLKWVQRGTECAAASAKFRTMDFQDWNDLIATPEIKTQ